MQRVMERNKPCTCKQCHRSFEAVRFNAETCSSKCRKAYSRWLKELDRHEAVALHLLHQIQLYKGTDRSPAAEAILTKVGKAALSMVDYW